MESFLHKYNLFYLFLYIIWPPLQMYYLHVDGAGRTILAMSILALVWNLPAFWRQTNVLRSPAFLCWMALVAFSIINSILKGYVSEEGALSFFKNNYINPFAFLYTMVIELDEDFERTLKVMFYALLVYVICGSSHMGLILVGADERIMAEGLGNLLPLHAACLVFVAGILFRNLQLSTILFWFIVVLALIITILSGTRKALGAILILLVGVITACDEERGFVFYLRVALFAATLYWGMGYVMDHTLIGERLASGAEQSDVVFVEAENTNWFLKTLVGDRALMYVVGWALFLQHPISGIGVTNFMYVSGIPLRLHTEYMVQLCENGIVGFSLFIGFIYFLFKGLLERIQKGKEFITLFVLGLLAILFLCITAWIYNATFGMIFIGIIIAYSYGDKSAIDEDDDKLLGIDENQYTLNL